MGNSVEHLAWAAAVASRSRVVACFEPQLPHTFAEFSAGFAATGLTATGAVAFRDGGSVTVGGAAVNPGGASGGARGGGRASNSLRASKALRAGGSSVSNRAAAAACAAAAAGAARGEVVEEDATRGIRTLAGSVRLRSWRATSADDDEEEDAA